MILTVTASSAAEDCTLFVPILLSYEEINNSSGGEKQRSIDIVHQKFTYKADRQVN